MVILIYTISHAYTDMSGRVYGQLDHLIYETSCAIDRNMESGNDTRNMLAGALKHVATKHPEVEFYSLNDKADKLVKRLNKIVIITPRRLLQGKQGWYQEYFGAMAHPDTERVLSILEKPSTIKRIQKNLHITQQMDWGDTNDIEEIAPQILPKSLGLV